MTERVEKRHFRRVYPLDAHELTEEQIAEAEELNNRGKDLFRGAQVGQAKDAFQQAIGTNFLYVAGAGYWAGLSEGTIKGVYLWPNIVAMAISGHR